MRLQELEIKIAIPSKEQFKHVYKSCLHLFGSPSSHFKQLDEYYDTPDSQLQQQDLVVRIRSEDKKKTIALKSPRIQLSNGMTKRIELEFESADGDKIHEKLFQQGLQSNESYEKERWTFVHHDCEIVLDKLPFIGTFIEIEGPSEEAINEVIHLLDISNFPTIQNHYGELMKAKFLELQLPMSPLHATFSREQELIYL
jgi:adenylate cyclase, class 2